MNFESLIISKHEDWEIRLDPFKGHVRFSGDSGAVKFELDPLLIGRILYMVGAELSSVIQSISSELTPAAGKNSRPQVLDPASGGPGPIKTDEGLDALAVQEELDRVMIAMDSEEGVDSIGVRLTHETAVQIGTGSGPPEDGQESKPDPAMDEPLGQSEPDQSQAESLENNNLRNPPDDRELEAPAADLPTPSDKDYTF